MRRVVREAVRDPKQSADPLSVVIRGRYGNYQPYPTGSSPRSATRAFCGERALDWQVGLRLVRAWRKEGV